jgi:RNA polymerase sigma factor (sigma-70 family)
VTEFQTEAETATAPDTAARVSRARAGDRRALDELIAAHLPVVYNVIGRGLNGHADVDDLVQDTMLCVIRGLPTLDDPALFRSWVVSIAYRQLHRHRRRHLRAVPAIARREDPTEVADPRADFAERTATEFALTGQRRELAEAARWLEPADRHLLSLWWLEAAGQLTRAELAAALTVSSAHAAVRVQRMKTQLTAARAVVRALRATPRCERLAGVTRGWDGSPGGLWRKRLNRHLRDCLECRGHLRGLIEPERLLSGMGLLATPAILAGALRQVVETAPPVVAPATAGGHALLDNVRNLLSTKQAAAAATVAVIAGGGLTYAVLEKPDATAAPPPAVAASPAAPRSLSPTPTTAPTGAATPTASAPRAASGVLTADIYVAVNGSDSADGSLARPYATLGKAVSVARAGQTIALRGGTYRPSEPVRITVSGTRDARITLSNYRDERPVIDASRVPAKEWAITQQASWWTVQGLELKNSGSHAYVCRACQHVTFRRLSIHDNVEAGLTLRDAGTVGNQVLDSDFHDNHDDGARGKVGNGLGIKFGSGTGNVVRGCRFYHNADDGLDLGEFASPVTVAGNWAYGNGVNRWNVADWQGNGNGFSLGGAGTSAAHIVRDNAAWDNVHHGFTDEDNPGRLQLTGNTAYRNGGTGFSVADADATLRGNLALANGTDARLGDDAGGTGNSWDGGTWTAAVFRGTDPASAQRPRRPDGRLPATDFLVPTRAGVGATMKP